VQTGLTAPEDPSEKCPRCGAANSGSNRFCGYCGSMMARPEKPNTQSSKSPSSAGVQHVYHHHYHHHIFPEEETGSGQPSELRWNGQPPVDAAEESPSNSDTRNSANPASESPENSIQKLVREWSVRFNSKRIDDLLALYTSDAIVLRPNVAPVHGREGIRKLLQAAVDAGLGDVELDCADLGMVNDFACLAGRSKMLVPTAPAKRHEETGKYLIVVRREASEWKIIADSWCMDSPKMQPASAATVPPIRAQK